MSKIADDVHIGLKKLFPNNTIITEYYINYRGTRLFFDFFIKDLGVLIECQGEQHYTFVAHFHSVKENFYAQKKRDNFKLEYVEKKSGLTLVLFYDKIDKINEDLILQRIYEGLDE